MELRHLEFFLAVAETGSFTRAARRLHLVQSGVSATVKALEHELGSALLIRSRQQVSLTPAGEALLPRARAALDAVRAARDAVHRTQGALHGTVTVGTLTSIDLVDLPGLMAALRDRHPGVTVRLRASMTGSAGLAGQLREGLLDVAFLGLPGPPRAGLSTRLLAAEPAVLYVPAAHPLARKGRATLAELADFPFIDSPAGFTNRAMADHAFAAAGREREVTVEVANVGTIGDFVRAGLGVAFLVPFLVRDLDGLAAVHVTDHDLRWQLAIATAATRRPSAATRAFLDLVEEWYPTLPDRAAGSVSPSAAER
ncbi:LysR family transcriptional regulator [Catenuloplanes japonicus]|uniref:LysR family transcriptional regulator n=1 Tax=Catenuloplanes japonicus TaxID=33876 RepID=UPI000689D418|nr:LysR family transcriptional regulator [Catenuloplanes japonicus]